MKKTINDNTVVRVRVPRKLYEAIQERMKQEETKKMEEAEEMEENYGMEEEGALNETDVHSLIQSLESIATSTPGMVGILTAMVASAKMLADKIKKQGADVSGSTGAGHGLEESKKKVKKK